jgi:hypothetical protein
MPRLKPFARVLLLLALLYIGVALMYGVVELPLTLAGFTGPRAKLACGLVAVGGIGVAAMLAWRRGIGRWVRAG